MFRYHHCGLRPRRRVSRAQRPWRGAIRTGAPAQTTTTEAAANGLRVGSLRYLHSFASASSSGADTSPATS